MKVDDVVLNVLDRAETDGPHLRIVEQLDRKLYVAVNKVLEARGGKWNRSKKAHVFGDDAATAVEQVILTGEVTTYQEIGYFPTPPAVVERLLELAEIEPDMMVLEPSAGQGAIADAVAALGAEVYCVENDPTNFDILRTRHSRVSPGDFLIDVDPARYGPFDRVVMNPPFARQADIDHVTHALRFVKPSGKLVSVMSNGVSFRDNRKTVEFRRLLDSYHGRIHELPADSFRESGTLVRTVIVEAPA